ncbi:hypothetical protein Syun_029535 [Stephania yunnanensis]|uniref:Uncharacterized protein n=1 Tax=Stephania yunnanensis TaxID=152371 RepID=A0AAP0E5T3_9MAGN
MNKYVIDGEVHFEKSDQKHMMDRSNLTMMGLVFDEVTHRWDEKKPERDQVNEGGWDQRDNDDEDNKKGEGEGEGEGEDRLDIHIQENDIEVESTKMGGYKTNINGDRDGDVVTLLWEGIFMIIESLILKVNEKGDHMGWSRQMSEAIFRTGGDVNAGLETLHKDMYSLMKRANEVAEKVESSSKITKEFIERLNPVVQECNKAPHDRMVCKNWKHKWT